MDSDKFNSFGQKGKRKTPKAKSRTQSKQVSTGVQKYRRPPKKKGPASLPVVNLVNQTPKVKKVKMVKTVIITPYPHGTVKDRTTPFVNIFQEYLIKKGLIGAPDNLLFLHQQYFFIIWQIAMLSEINHDFGEGARSKQSTAVAFGALVKKFLRAQLLDIINKFMISGGFKQPVENINLKIPELLDLINLNPKLKAKINSFFLIDNKLNANYLKELGQMINEDTGIIMARPDQYFSEPFLERYLKTLNPEPLPAQLTYSQRYLAPLTYLQRYFGATTINIVTGIPQISKNLFIFVDAVASSGDLQDVLKYIYQYLDQTRNPPSLINPYESMFKVYFIQSPASKFDSAGVSFLEKILSGEGTGFSGFHSWSKSNTFYPLDLFGPSKITFELTIGPQYIYTPTVPPQVPPTGTITQSGANYILYNFTYTDTSPGQTSLTINTINNEPANTVEQDKLKLEINNFSLPSIIASQTLQDLINEFENNTNSGAVTNFNKLLSVMLVKSMGDLGQELTALFTFEKLKSGIVYNRFTFDLSNTQLVYLTIDQFSFLLLQYLPTIPAILGKKAVSDEERKKATNISSVPYEMNFPLKFNPTMDRIRLIAYLKTLYHGSETDAHINKIAYMLEHDYAVEEFDMPELNQSGKKIGNELDVTRYYNYFISRGVRSAQIIKSIIIQLTNDKLNYWKKQFFEKPIITQVAINADIVDAGNLLSDYFNKYNSPRIPPPIPPISPIPLGTKQIIFNELIKRYTEMLNTPPPSYMPFGKKRFKLTGSLKQLRKSNSKIKQINSDIKYLSK